MIWQNIFLLICLSCICRKYSDAYLIGVGRADCTGPPNEIRFMGYANFIQVGRGLHLRQFARAFVVEDDNKKRVAYVSVDAGMMGYGVKREVLKLLHDNFGDVYSDANLVISGTHTHGAPGGFLEHVVYDISILGFVPQTFDILVEGIFLSIKRATKNMVSGKIYLAKALVQNVNINRSPTSYLRNPAEERAQYEYDVDKQMTQLRLVDAKNNLMGVFNWYAIHATSMNNTNRLVSSDNMGFASVLLEKEYNPGKMPGKGTFVGAFCSSNLGDVSPNIMGPKCSITGNECDLLHSQCKKGEGECFASGPGRDMFESTRIIATRLAEGAMRLLNDAPGREVTGNIDYVHQFVDMPNYNGSAYNPQSRKADKTRGCEPAMGYSFAAGTTDGPGAFDFKQGTVTDNPFWNSVRDFIVPPTKEDVACQKPKPILLATGRAIFPYEWQPKIVPTQLLKIGDLLIPAVPGEFTTMAGRRLRNKLGAVVAAAIGRDVDVVIAGLSNLYTSYITTFEEYQAQRYEAASTIFGPNTHEIYMNVYSYLTKTMLSGGQVAPGPSPPYFNDRLITVNTPVVFDGHPLSKNFGFVEEQPKSTYLMNDTVNVTFISGNPRNNLFNGQSYFVIQRKISNDEWETLYTDASWETRMTWKRTHHILGFSALNIYWTIEADTLPGEYQIKHFGNYKHILGEVIPYEGLTKSFTVMKK